MKNLVSMFQNKKVQTVAVMLLAVALIAPGMVAAGTTGNEFQAIYDTVIGWAGGYLGKTIAFFAFLIGLGVGAARATPVPAIAGVVFALFVGFGPGVIEGIATSII